MFATTTPKSSPVLWQGETQDGYTLRLTRSGLAKILSNLKQTGLHTLVQNNLNGSREAAVVRAIAQVVSNATRSRSGQNTQVFTAVGKTRKYQILTQPIGHQQSAILSVRSLPLELEHEFEGEFEYEYESELWNESEGMDAPRRSRSPARPGASAARGRSRSPARPGASAARGRSRSPRRSPSPQGLFTYKRTGNPSCIEENEYAIANEIRFSGFSSCIGIVARLSNDEVLGIHLGLFDKHGNPSTYFEENTEGNIQKVINLITRPVLEIKVIGETNYWGPLNKLLAKLKEKTGVIPEQATGYLDSGNFGAKVVGQKIEITKFPSSCSRSPSPSSQRSPRSSPPRSSSQRSRRSSHTRR